MVGKKAKRVMQMIFATRSGGRRKHFRRQHDKKVNVLGLLAVMTAPDAALVPRLQAAQSQLLAGCLKLLVDLKKQQVCFAQQAPVHVSELLMLLGAIASASK